MAPNEPQAKAPEGPPSATLDDVAGLILQQTRLIAEQNGILALIASKAIAGEGDASDNRNYQGWLGSVISTGVGAVQRGPPQEQPPPPEPEPDEDD